MNGMRVLALLIAFAVGTAIFTLSQGQSTKTSGFRVPDQTSREKAAGSLRNLSAEERAAFGADANAFLPIAKPKANDWLGAHRETGQTFNQFLRSFPVKPDRKRKVIYIQPLGSFEAAKSPSLKALREFAEAFFHGLEVKTAKPLDPAKLELTTRINSYSRQKQILSLDVLEAMRKRLPPDAFCVLAVTMTDLYPDPKWNFVFGQASLRERTGVFSFARYHPAFYGEESADNQKETSGEKQERAERQTAKLVLERSCKVLVHETGHMFGIKHCIYYQCIMNGSNHLEESDSKPWHLCPVCLRKLSSSTGFSLALRYEKLAGWHRTHGFEKEERWCRDRARQIRTATKKADRE